MLKDNLFKAEKLTDYITRIMMPGNVYGFIVTGKEKAAVIDTGFGLGDYRSFVEETLAGMPYDVILTHGHLDHAGGSSQFDEVYMNLKDLQVAKEHTQKTLRLDFLKSDYSDITEQDLAEPKPVGYLPLEYGQRFDLGGEVLQVVCLGGHTPGSVGILFEKQRILLAGDACCSFTLLLGGDESLSISEYRDNLKKLIRDFGSSFDTMLYSHPHNYGGPVVISEMIELCDDILSGKDDRIFRPGLFGRESYVARKTGEDDRRLDGRIANLQYCRDSIK